MAHLPTSLGVEALPAPALATAPAAMPPHARGADAEDAAIRHAAATVRGMRKELAQHQGLSERTLYRRLKALGLA